MATTGARAGKAMASGERTGPWSKTRPRWRRALSHAPAAAHAEAMKGWANVAVPVAEGQYSGVTQVVRSSPRAVTTNRASRGSSQVVEEERMTARSSISDLLADETGVGVLCVCAG